MLLKILSYYKKMNQPAKASLWFVVCGFLQKAISMLTTPFFAAIMTESEYGQFATYNAWFSILQVIVTLNLSASVYTRGLVKNEEDKHRFSSTMLGLSTVIIGAFAIIYGIFHNIINDFVQMSTVLMCALFIDIWAHEAFYFWSSRERVDYRYKKLIIVTLTYIILRPTLGFVAVLFSRAELQMEARVAAAVLVNIVLFSGLYFSMIAKGKKLFNKEYWIYALKFNIPLIPHHLSQVLLNQSDRIMIADMCGEAYAGYYTSAYTIALVLLIVNTSISGTMNPWIYRSIRDNKTESIGKTSYAVLILIAVLNFAIVVIAPEILSVFPESHQVAVWIIPPVAVSLYFIFVYTLFANFEYYYEKTRYVMIASLIAAVLNIILNLIFIRLFGFIAAGYTTLASYIVCAFVHFLFIKKVCEKELPGVKIYNPFIIFAIGFLLMLLSAVMMLFYGLPYVRYAILLLLAVIVIIKRKSVIRIIKAMK